VAGGLIKEEEEEKAKCYMKNPPKFKGKII
jgi:hypothetical protein